jgi:hypothetical protein
MDLSKKSYQEKRAIAKDLGLEVGKGTKGVELDRMLVEAIPGAEIGGDALSEEADRDSKFPKLPPQSFYFFTRVNDRDLKAEAELLYAELRLVYEKAKKFYGLSNQHHADAPRLPADADDSMKELFRAARKWFQEVATVRIALQVPVELGGKRIGPGKKIEVTRSRRDEIRYYLNKQREQKIKLLTGENAGSYFDSVMGLNVQDVH